MAYIYSLSGFVNLQTGLLLIIVFILICWLISQWQTTVNHPPGPWGCPILGYIPNLAILKYSTGMQPYRIFAKLAQKYGKIYSIFMGSKRVVVITDWEIAKEAFKNPFLNDRPLMTSNFPNSYLGILLSSGKLWQHQRRFTLNQFRQLGIGKTSFQEKISEETQHLLQEFDKTAGTPISPNRLITNAVSNVLCSVVFGKRFEYDNADFRHIIGLLDESFRLAGNGALHLFIPILAHLQPKKHAQHLTAQMQCFINGIINEHKEKYSSGKFQDYIDVYLSELEHAKNNNATDEKEETLVCDMSIYQTITQLFAAGSETSVSALCWALLYMMTHPELQNQIQQEIDLVVGRNRMPSIGDDLPLTEATLMEVQRIVSVAPLGVPHKAAEDTTLRGYTIQKGTLIMCNIWGIHHDPEFWKDPEEFRPARFLDSNGCITKPRQYMPFSTGRRKCIGEHLAKMELFLMFSHLLHQFSFTKPPGSSDSSLEVSTPGVTNAPKPFQVVAVKR